MKTPLLIVGSMIFLAACQPEEQEAINQSQETNLYQQATVDASSSSNWTYFDLANNKQVSQGESWQIALSRYNVLLNEGISSAIINEQQDFYDQGNVVLSQFINATSDGEQEHLLEPVLVDDLAFEMNKTTLITGANDINFYDYSPINHKLYANDDAVWVIRSNTGNSYAKLRPVQLFDDAADSANGAYQKAIFELNIQSENSDQFSDQTVLWQTDIPAGVGKSCYDIDAEQSVDCTDENWDIKFDLNVMAYQFSLTLNGGVSGPGLAAAVYTGAYSYADNEKLTAGLQNTAGFEITPYHYAQDNQESVFTKFAWYEYAINGGHGIWPNYRVYAIQDADKTYVIQFVNYYNDMAESGFITFKHLELK